jgi:hypothetical protein
MHDDLSVTALPFMAGILCGLVVFTITMYCTLQDFEPEPRETAGDLFEAENVGDDDDDFRIFIIRRLVESAAFRAKLVNGMALLHEKHPGIYAQVMRK